MKKKYFYAYQIIERDENKCDYFLPKCSLLIRLQVVYCWRPKCGMNNCGEHQTQLETKFHLSMSKSTTISCFI